MRFEVEAMSDIESICHLAQECHILRGQDFFQALEYLRDTMPAYSNDLDALQKLLCKLGKHITVTRKLFEASIFCWPGSSINFEIKTVTSSGLQPFPIRPKDATVESTIGRMFSSSEVRNAFLEKFDPYCAAEVSSTLQDRRKLKTKVHAELLLIDHFDRNGCNFLSGLDKYIGCSKPACYLCYAYIAFHPEGYAVSASHQKLYIGWRIPDVSKETKQPEERLRFQENILLQMIRKVRQDLQADVDGGVRHPYHPDSTAGITSERDSQVQTWLKGIQTVSVALSGKSDSLVVKPLNKTQGTRMRR